MMKNKEIISTLTVKLTQEQSDAVRAVAIASGETAASRAMIRACMDYHQLLEQQREVDAMKVKVALFDRLQKVLLEMLR